MDGTPRPVEYLVETAGRLRRGTCIWCLEKLSGPRVVGKVRWRLGRLEHYSHLSIIMDDYVLVGTVPEMVWKESLL